MTRVLVVDDDAALARALAINLRARGYDVDVATSGREALEGLASSRPDVVVLDLGLPDLDGIDVLHGIRGWNGVPVVVLSARTTSDEKVEALDAGADDYVTKPFSPRELAARIRAMRRRPRAAAQQEVREFGRLMVDPVAREVTVDGENVELTKIEFDILDLLSGSPRRTFTREQLLVQVWGEWFGDDHVIEVHMGKLRKKLGESASQPRHIRTLRGVGYRFEPA